MQVIIKSITFVEHLNTKIMSKLPAIKDVYGDIELAVKQDGLMAVLNQPPKQEWVKEHPYVKNYKYLPIERVEWLLKSIFKIISSDTCLDKARIASILVKSRVVVLKYFG